MKKNHKAKQLASHVMVVLATTIFTTIPGFANPVLDNVAAGQVSIQQVPNSTVVNQGSPKAIINWHSFNIGAGERTHFQQPAGGIALNRINPGQGASQIYGHLSATGKIILVNQSGIFFGPGSYVNVGGIIASTSDISDSNFLAGQYKFDRPSPYSGSVINEGTIRAAKNGLVALIGTGVRNDGTIQARMGSVVLASGNKFTVDLAGDGLVSFTVDEAATSAGVDQNGHALKNGVSNGKHGVILADGGTIIMTAREARGVVDNAINMRGIAQARSVSSRNGVIILDGGDGNVRVSGRIDVSGRHKNTQGGTVKILANNIHLTKSAVIDASGYSGGGEVLIGGNYQGKGPEQNASTTRVDQGASIRADAIQNGNGGKVIVWSNDDTRFYGSISAKGGALGGDGGFVETSGHYLDVANAKINLLAPLGTTGTWLLDPENLTIQTAGVTTATHTGNTFTSNVDDSILTVSDLQNALATASILVVTGAGGAQVGDITIANSITWSAVTKLTISAYRNITVNAGATITNTAGGSLTLEANNNAAFAVGSGQGIVTNNGTFLMSGGGSIAIHYTPNSYTTPVSYTNTGTDSLTAFMVVNNATDLQNLNQNLSGTYALNQRIDLTGVNFTPIGSSGTPFTGRFEGDDHTIVNLAISAGSTTDVGLFGATSNAVLANFGLVNPSVTGSQNVGAAVGLFNGGSMDSVYTSAGSVTGITNVGGLIGNIQAGTVSNLANFSVASATVSNVGGLVGNNSGTILTSFSQGFVSGGASPGGLVGVGAGTVTSSYWDNQTSGQPTLSAGGLGVATSTLQGGLPGGFSAGTWSIIAGTSYPYLTIFNTSQPRILSGNATTTGGHPVYLANNGSQVDTANTGANGYFYFQEHNGTLTGGSPYLIYQNNGGSSVGNLLGLLGAGNASTTTLSLSPGFIKVNGGPVTGFTTTDMATVAGSLSDVNILYSVSGSNLTLGNATHPNVTFQASGAGGFTINHVISSTGTTTALDMSAPVTINSTGVTTTGSQSYTDSVILNASSLTTLTSSNGAGISFSDTVNGPQGLSIGNGSGAISFSNFNVGGTSALASLSIGTGDTTAINITSIRTSGAQTYNSAVNLGAGSLTTLTSTGAGGISFGSTVNGPQGLSIANGSGAVSLGGILGGTSSLASLLIGTGNTTALNTTSIRTSGSQTYNSAVNLGAGSLTTLTSTGAGGVSFGSTLNGPQGLSIANSSGAVSLGGVVGGTSSLASLLIGTGDTTALNATGITTSGAQTYNSAVNLGAGSLTTLASTGASGITFGSTLNGPQGLSIGNSSGAVSFAGVIGGSSSLASLLIGSGDTTAMNTNTVTTSGSQTYDSAVNLGFVGLTTFTTNAGNISLIGALTGGAQSLTLTGGTGGDHVFALDDVVSIGTLNINGNASVANTIDFSGYVVPIVLTLSPPSGNVFDSGSLVTNTSSPIGSFGTIQTAIGTNTGQSVLVLPDNVPGISVTYTNPAHTSGTISDPFTFINFAIANPPPGPAPTPTPTPTPEPGPTPVDINFIGGTTAFITNNKNMEIINDGVDTYYDYFESSPWVNQNIDSLIKQQDAMNQYQTTKLTCYATSLKDPELKDCRIYPVRRVSEL